MEERASDPALVDYALNMFPLDPERGGAYCVRPPFVPTSGTPFVRSKCFHYFIMDSGTARPCAVVNDEIWVLAGETTWTKYVSSSTFATAGISLDPSAQTYYAITFAGVMIVSDGVNTPWTWDGSLESGLTLLSNCPALYGRLTEYAGKLFGIKAADHRTMVWSEENDPTTGYEAGGFNNAWTIAQQADEPLTALLGRNDALYYWRSNSVGAISGAVNQDFRTTHTHDAIALGVGTIDPGSIVDSGSALWWYGTNERVYCYEVGGGLQDVSPAVSASHVEDPVPGVSASWYRTRGAHDRRAYTASGALVGPNAVNDRLQVWLSLPGQWLGTAGDTRFEAQSIILVYDVGTRRPLGWFHFAPTNVAAPLFFNLTTFGYSDRQKGRFPVSTFAAGQPAIWNTVLSTPQTKEFNSYVTGVLVGPVAGGTDDLEVIWTDCAVALRLPAKPAADQPPVITLAPASSGIPSPTLLSAVPQPATANLTTGRAVFGFESAGRAFRPSFTLTWNGGERGYGLQGYTVKGRGVVEEPNAL